MAEQRRFGYVSLLHSHISVRIPFDKIQLKATDILADRKMIVQTPEYSNM